jgi:hypothetical protein
LPKFDDPIRKEIVENGIDYEYYLNHEMFGRNRKYKELWKDLSRSKMEENIRSVSAKGYARERRRKMRTGFLKERGKVATANLKRRERLREKMEFLRKRKSRNQLCREKREREFKEALEGMANFGLWAVWGRFMTLYLVMIQVKKHMDVTTRIKKSRKSIVRLGAIVSNFLIPLKRGKKSSEIGCFMRTKM